MVEIGLPQPGHCHFGVFTVSANLFFRGRTKNLYQCFRFECPPEKDIKLPD